MVAAPAANASAAEDWAFLFSSEFFCAVFEVVTFPETGVDYVFVPCILLILAFFLSFSLIFFFFSILIELERPVKEFDGIILIVLFENIAMICYLVFIAAAE